MTKEEKYIELFSGNWLNNAAILGFLISLKEVEEEDVKQYFISDGRVAIRRSIFEKLEVQKRYFTDKLCNCLIIGNVSKTKKEKYINYINPSTKGDKEGYEYFVKELQHIANNGATCALSNLKYSFNVESIEKLNKKWKELGSSDEGFVKFLSSISKVSNRINEKLGGADSYPNGYWAFRHSTYISPLFAFLIIHQHLAFTKLMDNSKIFINAPSFGLMYELNRILSKLAEKENATYRNLLAMSVIEFSVKTNVMLHTWTSMDIEIVAIDRTGVVEFISLPYETIKLLSNKKIAELLSSIGEFRILNMVIDNKWKDLVELGYRLLKISMKNIIGKEDREFINRVFYSSGSLHSSSSIKQLANKLMKLYSLIEERTKNNKYGYING